MHLSPPAPSDYCSTPYGMLSPVFAPSKKPKLGYRRQKSGQVSCCPNSRASASRSKTYAPMALAGPLSSVIT